MDASPRFDDAPSGTPAFYATLPRKHVASGWLLRDPRGRVLLVKPAYKEPWEIPGGVVEADESPREACRREIQEELGVDLEPGHLLCVDHRPGEDGIRGDALRFVFSGGVLTDVDTAAFVLDPAELLEWRFVAPEDFAAYLEPALARRLRSCLAGEGGLYLENGWPPPDG